MMSATNLNTARPEWMSAQVTVNARSDFKIVMEGKATNGGYAIDQLVFSPGKCSSKLLFSSIVYNYFHDKTWFFICLYS